MAQRPLFDPSKIKPPADPPRGGGANLLSVRQVNELVRGAIQQQLAPTLHIIGEIGDLSRPASGHLYFTLKDPDSELRCVMWKSSAAALKFRPEAGMEVIATGGIEVYTPRGSYQLMVRRVEPRGVGALEIAFRQLREKLEREGLLDKSRKRPLPSFPRRVAIVTSISGAALRDILHTLRRRFAALDVFVFPVRVQGSGAAEEIAAAVDALNAHAESLGGIDVAIVGRGGGSLEDLWAFNEEVLARAIAASRIPIVSAVGHETDMTISDLVADLRAPTPTAAAELVTPARDELLHRLGREVLRAQRAIRHVVSLADLHLRRVLAYDGFVRPLARIREGAQRVDDCSERVRRAAFDVLAERRRRLVAAELAIVRFGAGAAFRRLISRVDAAPRRAEQAMQRRLAIAERRLHTLVSRAVRSSPERHLSRADEHVCQSLARIAAQIASRVTHARRELTLRLELVQSCDPRRVLKRGFSITRDARTGRIVRSVQEVREHMRVTIELGDGTVRGTTDDPNQPRLFE